MIQTDKQKNKGPNKVCGKMYHVICADLFAQCIGPWMRVEPQEQSKIARLHKKCLRKICSIHSKANRDMQMMDRLLEFLHHYRYKQSIKCGNHVCNKLNIDMEFKICKRCLVTFYCSKKCQKYDWNIFGHKVQCDMIQNSKLNNALK